MSDKNPSSPQVNKGHHGIKRIMQEVRELQQNPSSDYDAHPLEDNLFEWHFTIAGPKETPFEGGIYHGRIILPPEYPHKPPDIVLLTPNGRFETNTKICLSLTSYHPESWTPQWGIRTVLIALQGFFPTEAKGIGSIEYPDSTRRKLAVQSRKWRCEVCGIVNEDALHVPEVQSIETTSKPTVQHEADHQDCTCHEDNQNQQPVTILSDNQQTNVNTSNQQQLEEKTTSKPSNTHSAKISSPVQSKKSSVVFLDILIALFAIIVAYIMFLKFVQRK